MNWIIKQLRQAVLEGRQNCKETTGHTLATRATGGFANVELTEEYCTACGEITDWHHG